jgi:HSP20 family protein
MLARRFIDWPFESRWSPFGELDVLRRSLDRLREGSSRGFPFTSAAGVFPLANITENKDCYYVRAEVPGVIADEIDISVTGKTLSIAGERKIPTEEGASYHRRERRAGRFSRMITMPSDIDNNKVEAEFSNGVLTVKLPKAAAAKPRQITVKS